MAHKTLVNGTAYDIIGGITCVDGTRRDIVSGITCVDGTRYDITFGRGCTITIIGTGSAFGMYVIHDGTTYTSATTLAVEPGTTIEVCGIMGVYLNDEKVASGNSNTYSYTVQGDITIEFSSDMMTGEVYITEL